jgi:hypothetical protein
MRMSGYFSKPEGVRGQKILRNTDYYIGFVQTFRSIYGLHRRGNKYMKICEIPKTTVN